MVDDLFKLLGAAFTLWDDLEKNKYVDHLIDLKKTYYEEYAKPDRDDAYLDDLERELRVLSDSFVAKVGGSHPRASA